MEHLLAGMTYAEQVQYLTAYPEEIYRAWGEAQGIFDFVYPGSEEEEIEGCGCLTMIRLSKDWQAYGPDGLLDPELTEAIRKDTLLPNHCWAIQVQHLERFKQWREAIDTYYAGGELIFPT